MRSKPPIKRPGSLGKQAFLANLELVRSLLAENWSASDIYTAHRARFPFQYANFTRYVRRYLPAVAPVPIGAKHLQAAPHPTGEAQSTRSQGPEPPSEPAVAKREPGPVVADVAPARTFNHNPVADRDSLI